MLHVKIDLVPFGHEDNRKQISEIFIANVGVNGDGSVNYYVWKKDPRFPANPRKPDAKCKHKREDGCDILVMKAIEELNR